MLAVAAGFLAAGGASGCATSHGNGTASYYARAHSEPELAETERGQSAKGTVPAVSASTSSGTARKPAPAPAPARAKVTHKVEAGQTFYRIARMHEVTVEALMAANGITDPRNLAVGQVLVIPAPPPPPAAPSSPLPASVASAVGATSSADGGGASPPRAAPAPRAGPRQALVMPTEPGILDWPLRGVLYARFGAKGKERHDGIDLAAPAGTPVVVARAGTVLYAGEQKGYGLIVIVDHGDDLITLYAHNRDLRVKTGQKVRDGQVVATVGQTGRTSGPYLHFEVRRKGLPVDPLQFLGPPPDRKAVGRRAP